MTDVLSYLIETDNPRGFKKAMKLVDTYDKEAKTQAIENGLIAAVVNDNYDAFILILNHFGEQANIRSFYNQLLVHPGSGKYVYAYNRLFAPTPRMTYQPKMRPQLLHSDSPN